MTNMLKENECIFIEQQMGVWDECWAWHCSGCGEDWLIGEGTPQDNSYNYCPNCGRKIIGYRPYEAEESEGGE